MSEAFIAVGDGLFAASAWALSLLPDSLLEFPPLAWYIERAEDPAWWLAFGLGSITLIFIEQQAVRIVSWWLLRWRMDRRRVAAAAAARNATVAELGS